MDLELERYYYYNRMTDRNIDSSLACRYKMLLLLLKIIIKAILSVNTRSRLLFTLPTRDVVKIKIYNRRKTKDCTLHTYYKIYNISLFFEKK
jgi:hypothetical protein